MARKKTTVYIDERLLVAAKVEAARSGKREYEVFEDALRAHLQLQDVLDRVWSGIDAPPTDEEALRLSAREGAAVRAERSARKAG